MFDATFATLTSIYFLALLSPGQDFFLIMRYALSHGYKHAWRIVGGIALGNAFYIGIAYIGHELLSRYASFMHFVELFGAFFLMYLGYLLFFAPQPAELRMLQTNLHTEKLYWKGLLSALMNPKNVLFYCSLLLTIIAPDTSLHVKIFYALWMIGMLVLWDMFVAWIFGNSTTQKLTRYLLVLQKMIGIGLFGFGAYGVLRWLNTL